MPNQVPFIGSKGEEVEVQGSEKIWGYKYNWIKYEQLNLFPENWESVLAFQC